MPSELKESADWFRDTKVLHCSSHHATGSSFLLPPHRLGMRTLFAARSASRKPPLKLQTGRGHQTTFPIMLTGRQASRRVFPKLPL